MSADRYGLYSASFTHAGGSFDLTQLEGQSLSRNKAVRSVRPGGSLVATAHILSTANPRFSFRTTDLLAFFTASSGEMFLACSGGHVARYQKKLAGGAFASGSAHMLQTSSKGFLHVASIDAEVDGTDGASAVLEYIPLSTDGQALPFATTVSQSLSGAPAPAFSSQYYMGGVWNGSSQVTGLKRISFQPGVMFTANRTDGGVFPHYNASSIGGYNPGIGLTFLDLGLPNAIGSDYLAVVGAAIKGYLQRGTTAADGRIAVATTSHLKIACTDASWGPDETTVDNENDGTVTIGVMPTSKLTATLGVAIGG